MGFLIKWMIILGLLGTFFGAGYLAGSQRQEKLGQVLEGVRFEMKNKMDQLENEILFLRYRMHLTSTRSRLLAAQTSLIEKNYGLAKKELDSARADLRSAARMAPREKATDLSKLDESIGDLAASVERVDPQAGSRLDSVKRNLNRLIDAL